MEESETTPVETGTQAAAPESPPWNLATRRIVGLTLVGLLLVFLWVFLGLVAQVIVAALIAYLLNPVIGYIDRRSPHVRRGVVAILVYVAVVALLVMGLALAGVAVFNEVSDLAADLPELIDSVVQFISKLTNDPDATLRLGPYTIPLADLEWGNIQNQAFGLINPALREGPMAAGQVALGTLDVLGWLIITFIISLYIAVDLPRFGRDFDTIALRSGYSEDYTRLKHELVQIGNAYLRGQVILGLVVGTLTGVLLALLGVRNALALGIVAGVLEMVPYIGPLISAVVAVAVAFFQPENYLGLGQVQFAIATLAVMLLVQQIENNFLVPRVVGDALNLKPLTVIIAVLMGGALAGIWGIILAAPVAAVIKLMGSYVLRKMLNLPPFPLDGEHEEARAPTLLGRALGSIRIRGRRRRRDEDDGEPPAAARA